MESILFKLVNDIESVVNAPLNDHELDTLANEVADMLDRNLPGFVNYLSLLEKEKESLTKLDLRFIKLASKCVLKTLDVTQKQTDYTQFNHEFMIGFHCIEWLKAVAVFSPNVFDCELSLIYTCSTTLEPSPTTKLLPSELDTEQARIYFNRAVEAGLMSEQYKWLKSKALLACFCREMSIKLDLGKGYNSEGQKRLCWKPFEALFCIEKGSLRASLNEIQKTGQNPIGIEKVNDVFLYIQVNNNKVNK